MKCQPVSTLRRRDEDAGSAAPDRSGRSRHLKSLFRVSGMAGLFLLAGVATSVVPAFSDLQAGQHGAPAESKASTRGGVPVTRTAAAGDVGADMCRIPAPKGPWDYHLARDLPQGSCSEAQACTLWTKDSCPGEAYPGPAIRWMCVCTSGLWRCDEQERTRATCAPD